MYALVDCNNFYASCERVFKPSLERKPVIVLSNNDGCAIARSEEAKAIGINMGMPAFMMQDIIKEHEVAVFSSNYTLYGDMSERVMKILTAFSPRIELYSIDEAFLDFTELKWQDHEVLASRIRREVKQFTGIPVTVGIAPTKTLAKMANRFAKKMKKNVGVHCLANAQLLTEVLKNTPVGEVWGIGKQHEKFLLKKGIKTALELSKVNEEFIRKNMSVVGQRMLNELSGIPSLKWEDAPPAKKEICTSRSFGKLLTEKKEIMEAVSNYASNVALKLRKQNSCAKEIQLFIQTNPFNTEHSQYFRSIDLKLEVPTNSTNEMIRYALKGLEIIFIAGYKYLKAGIIASDLVPETEIQSGLFDNEDRKTNNVIMKTMDNANKIFGRDIVRFASQGYEKKWKLRAAHLSPCYTTRYDQLLTIAI